MSEQCKEMAEKISAFCDEELSLQEKNMLEAHLHHCSSCRKKVKEEIAVKGFLQKKSAKEVPSEFFKERIISSFEEEEKGFFPKISVAGDFFQFLQRIMVPVLGFAACLVIFLVLSSTDTTSSPLTALVKEHQRCLSQGTSHYEAATEKIFSEKVKKILDIDPVTASILSDAYSFVRGDVCSVKGCTASHMIFKKVGKMLSLFQSHEAMDGTAYSNVFQVDSTEVKVGQIENALYGYWGEADIYYLVVGDLSEQEISELVLAISDNRLKRM